jgi:hypothetical protein
VESDHHGRKLKGDEKSGKVFDVDEILKNVKVHEEEVHEEGLNEVVLGKEGVKLRPEVRKTYTVCTC